MVSIYDSGHPFLKFDNSNSENRKCAAIINEWMGRKVAPPQIIDWNKFDEVGLTAELNDVLIREVYMVCHNGRFKDQSWDNMFRNNNATFMELTAEFLASFSFKKKVKPEFINKNTTIRFRLMGKWHDVTLPWFGYLCGLYSRDDVENEYFIDEYFDNLPTEWHEDQSEGSFWYSIAKVHRENARSNVEKDIRSPKIRFLHRLLTFTICASNHALKVPLSNMFPLKCFLEESKYRAHLPFLLALFFDDRARKKGKNRPLYGGQFITEIATNLGMSRAQRKEFEKMAPIEPTVRGDDYFRACIEYNNEGQASFKMEGAAEEEDDEVQGEDDEAAEAPANEVPESSHRNVRRQPDTPVQQGPQFEVDMRHLNSRFDAVEMRQNANGRYQDDIHHNMVHLGGQMHAIMQALCIEAPPPYDAPYQPYPYWDDRQGPPPPPPSGDQSGAGPSGAGFGHGGPDWMQ